MSKRIEITDLNVYYGSFRAVEDVTMNLEPRSVTAFIGPSGCGKSTFCAPQSRTGDSGARVEGEVLLDGEISRRRRRPGPGAPPGRHGVPAANPFPTMSIRENVLAGIKLNFGSSAAPSRTTSPRSLRSANLWEEVRTASTCPVGLSGGQQQRLCIARAIAMAPEVLLMDEPCSALDPISTLAIEDLISELKEKYTIVIVTHNMQQAARVSDVTAFFNIAGTGSPGKLIESGPTDKIFSAPDITATEDYISGRFG